VNDSFCQAERKKLCSWDNARQVEKVAAILV
jgi:hypothetical protein